MEEMDIFDRYNDLTPHFLDERNVDNNPMKQFDLWFNEALLSGEAEVGAMVLSTVTLNGKPSSRAVLLKQIKQEGFVFFTNYDSRKGTQLDMNPHCALNFVWKVLDRQVRIEGIASFVSPEESDSYFDSRFVGSKVGAWASPQSRVIPSREYLENLVSDFEGKFKEKSIFRPSNWGGYIVRPYMIEFWQGRENRLHDRIQYIIENGSWKIERLAP